MTDQTFDLRATSLRDLNIFLHKLPENGGEPIRITNPKGEHNIAVGLMVPATIVVEGPVGYYCGGMNKLAQITVTEHAGQGLAENIMSGTVRVKGNASQCAAATGRGGLVVIEGDAGARCGISMKGVDIVVGGNVGHMSAFLAQAGRLVVCGDAGPSLGDSIYEADVFVGGKVDSLGADCVEKEMTPEHIKALGTLLKQAGVHKDPATFRRFGSARKLYHFHVDHADEY
jgi:glutamate synthase domain-containing protein 3